MSVLPTVLVGRAFASRYEPLMSRSAIYLSGDNYDAVGRYEPDVDRAVEMIRRYTEGECAMLAERVHQLTGWPMVVLRESGRAVHWLNRRDDGALVDAHGAVHDVLKSIIARRHGVADAAWTEWSKRFPMDAVDTAEVDEFLNGAWMLAVIPPEDRLADPLPPFDFDDADEEEEDDDEA